MARPSKTNRNKNKDRTSKRVNVLLDRETLLLYNKNFKGGFSKWVRDQIHFHSANKLSPDQRLLMCKEEMAQANQRYKEAKLKAEQEYISAQSTIAKAYPEFFEAIVRRKEDLCVEAQNGY